MALQGTYRAVNFTLNSQLETDTHWDAGWIRVSAEILILKAHDDVFADYGGQVNFTFGIHTPVACLPVSSYLLPEW